MKLSGLEAENARLMKLVEDHRTVLRSLISCGNTSPTIKAMAMNTLEAGSGDAWLASRSAVTGGGE